MKGHLSMAIIEPQVPWRVGSMEAAEVRLIREPDVKWRGGAFLLQLRLGFDMGLLVPGGIYGVLNGCRISHMKYTCLGFGFSGIRYIRHRQIWVVLFLSPPLQISIGSLGWLSICTSMH